jgi:cyanophycin synthetase
VAVVTNIGEGDHLGLNFITTVEDLAVLKRVIVQNVAPGGHAVLNATDPIVAAMAATCPGQVCFFAADRHHPVMATHRAQGGVWSTWKAMPSSPRKARGASGCRWPRSR